MYKVNVFIDGETIIHSEVGISVNACANDYFRCTKCEVHDRIHKHVIGYTEKRVSRFVILEALWFLFTINSKNPLI